MNGIDIVEMVGSGTEQQSVLYGTIEVWAVILMAALYAAILVGLYLLRSFGLYKLAQKAKIEKAWLAFIPFVWIYVACKLVKNDFMFGLSFGKFALLLCIVFSVGEFLSFAYDFFKYFPYIGYYLQGGFVSIVTGNNQTLITAGSNFKNPFPSTETIFMRILGGCTSFLGLINIVITIFLFMAIFRKYVPRYYILYSVLSVLGLFPIMIFAIRKKEAVDFNEYMRARFYNPYGFNGYNPTNNPYNNRDGERPPDTPFSEFADKGEKDPGDPFEDFDDKHKDDKDDK